MKRRHALVLMLLSTAPVQALEYGDLVLDNTIASMKRADMPPVVFPHWFHRIRFKCKVCHEQIFVMKKGANGINMRRIMEGEACGVCHNGQIAWEPIYCDRCHTQDAVAEPLPPQAR